MKLKKLISGIIFGTASAMIAAMPVSANNISLSSTPPQQNFERQQC